MRHESGYGAAERRAGIIAQLIQALDKQIENGRGSEPFRDVFAGVQEKTRFKIQDAFEFSPTLSVERARYRVHSQYEALCRTNGITPVVRTNPPPIRVTPLDTTPVAAPESKGRYVPHHEPHPLGPEFDHWDW